MHWHNIPAFTLLLVYWLDASKVVAFLHSRMQCSRFAMAAGQRPDSCHDSGIVPLVLLSPLIEVHGAIPRSHASLSRALSHVCLGPVSSFYLGLRLPGWSSQG